MVLAGGEDVESDLLGLARDGDGGPDAVRLGGGGPGRGVGRDVTDREDAELHPRRFGRVHAELPPDLMSGLLAILPVLRPPCKNVCAGEGLAVPGAPRLVTGLPRCGRVASMGQAVCPVWGDRRVLR
ncbi:hypothetical protein SANT12839_019050 [Streptomyces antimycoticus]|uniref:Uncharacterized protein n=1 Tax=Streptomyces antimycoticus TaxID=68175 RepID=A0A4D4K532_9ACTN|nr:hypothetical protein SANT12839_019050 [Streptomyces antimycoticus]